MGLAVVQAFWRQETYRMTRQFTAQGSVNHGTLSDTMIPDTMISDTMTSDTMTPLFRQKRP
ncbi:hypothetical protein PZ78_08155 [Vreelandella venusta]|nr:hypothetical protein PZ78_08155 [Halomonas hydrothermalis]